MSMGDEEEEDEKVFYLVSNISKDNITAHSSVFNGYTVLFWFIHLKYESFASQYSKLNVHVTSGVYKVKLWLPIQIHYILPKSYLLGASGYIFST